MTKTIKLDGAKILGRTLGNRVLDGSKPDGRKPPSPR